MFLDYGSENYDDAGLKTLVADDLEKSERRTNIFVEHALCIYLDPYAKSLLHNRG